MNPFTLRNTLAFVLASAAIAFSMPASSQEPAIPKAETSYQDLWWGGASENGWGMSITQHANRLFAALYIYDRFGNATWVVMPGGEWASSTQYVGALYSPTGSPYAAYDASRFQANAAIGALGINFTDPETAQLRITIYGETSVRVVTRQKFAAGEPVNNYTDLWWGGASQNGWGLSLTQRGATLFGVWYTYDAGGTPTWFVMPGGSFDATGAVYSGTLYATRGSQWWNMPFDGASLAVSTIGSMTLDFQGPASARMTTVVNGQTQSRPIVRQPF